MLSRSGKEILLKSVAQAMPNFALSVFLMLLSLCEDLERLMNGFWWGSGTNGSSGIHWMGWKKLCVQHRKGVAPLLDPIRLAGPNRIWDALIPLKCNTPS